MKIIIDGKTIEVGGSGGVSMEEVTEEINNTIGDINSILDVINGEVV